MLLNQVKSKIPICGTIDPITVNNHYFCYQCSKDGTDLLFGSLSIRDKIYETFSATKTNTITYKYCMKILFLKDNDRKRRRFNMNRHKDIRIPDCIFKTKSYL